MDRGINIGNRGLGIMYFGNYVFWEFGVLVEFGYDEQIFTFVGLAFCEVWVGIDVQRCLNLGFCLKLRVEVGLFSEIGGEVENGEKYKYVKCQVFQSFYGVCSF